MIASIPRSMLRVLVQLMLLGAWVVAEKEEEKPASEEPGEEMPEEVGSRTDGTSIAYCIIGIMTVLIAVTCLFENIKDGIYERTPKPSLPIVDALFSEMTVLGFLSMVTFVVSSAGFINDLSVRIYGPSAEGEEFLKELFERAHYTLFLVMAVFFFIAIFILHQNSETIDLLLALREDVLRPEYLQGELLKIAKGRPAWWQWGERKVYHNACLFFEYLAMRREVIHGRRSQHPHHQLPEDQWLPLDFHYARYVSINLGRTVAETIGVDSWTWFQLWGLNLAMYLLLLAYPPKGQGSAVVCAVWLGLGYLEAAFIVYFYRHCLEVKWCLCLPEELPHVAFRIPDPTTGIPRARRVFEPQPHLLTGKLNDSVIVLNGHRATVAGGYQAINGDDDKASKAPALSAPSSLEMGTRQSSLGGDEEFKSASKTALAATFRAKGMSAAAAEQLSDANVEAEQMEGSDRGSPPWASVVTDVASRSKWRQWIGGRAPFRQLYLYWHEGNGPDFHIRVLRLHLVYVSIQVTLLVLAFAPLVKEHFGNQAYVAYLCAPLPHLIYTMGYVLSPLTRVVTEIGYAGILKDQKVLKEVLRMMKTEKSVKGLMLLTNMQRLVVDSRSKKETAKVKSGGKAGKEESKGSDSTSSDFLTTVAQELFMQKFVDISSNPDGSIDSVRVGPDVFKKGLNFLANFTSDEAARAFALADTSQSLSVSSVDFVHFFKRLHHSSAWKTLASDKDAAIQALVARLHGCFQVVATSKEDKASGVGLTAEEELKILHREHGRAVHEIVMLFDQYDTNNDGSLDFAEVRVMISNLGEDLTETEAQQLVNHLDRDGDGEVSMAEFVVWAFKRQQATKPMDVEELAGEIFDLVFDRTSDGKIDVNEFIAGLEHIKSALSYDEKHELFREADENGGGFIDKEEFVALLMKYSDEAQMR